MKKFTSLLMALVMMFALSATAFAEEGPFILTITGAAGHVYDIYQIYTGDVSQEDGKTVLSNVKYGQNHYPVNGQVGDPVPENELTTLINAEDPVGILDSAVNDRANPYKRGLTPAENASSIEITGIEAGYYMIVDVTTDLPDGQTKSPIILQVLETVTIASKHASIVSEKKVDDKNDSDTSEDGVNWQDSADYDFGDAVPFQLSVTIPSTYHTYDNYTLTFHDQQAAGFDNPTITSVYILKPTGAKITINPATANASGYSLLACTSDKCEFGGCSFTVQVGDVNDFYTNVEDQPDTAFAEGDKIIVEYTSVLKNTANVGLAGNENSMYVCHPDGHTPQDDVTVLTYQLKVNKIDGASKNALVGAGFTLYKKDSTGAYNAVGTEQKGDGVTSFTWPGIDAGTYKLVETTTPTGYNTIADIEFVVEATHKSTWLADGNYALEDVIAKNLAGTTVIFADKDANGLLDGKMEGNIENYKGAVLPETGGTGTVMLISASSLFVVLAAVFMITRKKMSIYAD